MFYEAGDQAALLSAGLSHATFEEKRKLVQLLLPKQHGCGVTLHDNGAVEIRGILPTPSTTLGLRLKTKAG